MLVDGGRDGPELCGIINGFLRLDDPAVMPSLAVIVRAINQVRTHTHACTHTHTRAHAGSVASKKHPLAPPESLSARVRACVQLCVANRAVRTLGPDDWPARGECFRGATLPAAHRGFYTPGTKYRVPG